MLGMVDSCRGSAAGGGTPALHHPSQGFWRCHWALGAGGMDPEHGAGGLVLLHCWSPG